MAEYEASQTRDPNRYRGYWGAGTAAAQAGNKDDKARQHYAKLVDLAGSGDPRAEVAKAREYVGTNWRRLSRSLSKLLLAVPLRQWRSCASKTAEGPWFDLGKGILALLVRLGSKYPVAMLAGWPVSALSRRPQLARVGQDQEGPEACLPSHPQSEIVGMLRGNLRDVSNMDERLAVEHARKRVVRAYG